jgi:integrase
VEGLTREVVAAILAAPDPSTRTGKRDLVFLTLLYATAARLDEILSIRLSHLYLDAAKPYVNLYGKGNKIRTAYLLPRAVEHIRSYMKAFHEPESDPEMYLSAFSLAMQAWILLCGIWI